MLVAVTGNIGSGKSTFARILEEHGARRVDADALARIRDDHDAWDMFLRWELDYCREPGAIDAGTHIIAVARRA